MERLKLQLERIALNYFKENSLHGLDEDLNESKKLINVKEVHNIGDEEVFFIYDDTLFGSAKDGMVFGEDTIYWREKFGNPEKMTYGEIVESTANKNIKTNKIRIFNKENAREEDNSIQIKDLYYNFISELKEELVNSIPRYQSYYENTINSMEILFMELEKNNQYSEIINMISKYEGLFLKEEDKSNKIREISFKVYLSEKMFDRAKEELDLIEKENFEFHEKAKEIFELGLKENEYDILEEKRKIAIDRQEYEEAYFIFNQQKKINIKNQEDLLRIETEIKEAQYNTLNIERLQALEEFKYEIAYSILNSQKEINIKTSEEIQEIVDSMKLHEFKSLEQERLMAIEKEEFNIAYLILKKQRKLNIKEKSEILEIEKSIEKSKSETLKKYHDQLKILVDNELFIESKKVINSIYRIEPTYSLDREEILLKIYQYKLDEAKEAIEKLTNILLKSELEEIFNENSKKIYQEIRDAARMKDYNYFEFFPHLWNYKDEYSMSAIHYFALEGNSEGLLRALDGTDHLIMHSNIYGHNFLDLLGLACDLRFGNSNEVLLDILYRIEYFVENEEIGKRIRFLKTGKKEDFYSYDISQELLEEIKEKEVLKIQELRLKELNNKLMSNIYFEKVEKELRKQIDNTNKNGKINIEVEKNKIIKTFYTEELKRKNDYPIKEEFERLEEYKVRCDEYIEEYLIDEEYIEEYKKQNPDIIEEMIGSINYSKRYFIPELLAFIDYREKSFKKLESLNTVEGFLELLLLYFPIKHPFVKIGNYDIEKEEFFILINDLVGKLPVPLSIAKEFKDSFENLENISQRVFEEDKIIDAYSYEFQGEKIILPFKIRENILNLK